MTNYRDIDDEDDGYRACIDTDDLKLAARFTDWCDENGVSFSRDDDEGSVLIMTEWVKVKDVAVRMKLTFGGL